ncbi:MAG: nucleoside-diphosphate sugar epimerase, partial [Alphaproteobacteria bacterium]|nr:nucleoside-diphosphate sugar epimerase [Alphaproteobacteria bacterium]
DFAGKSLAYADFIMAYGSERSLMPAIVSTIKLRQAGFTEVMDSEAMMRKWIADLQAHRLLPPR